MFKTIAELKEFLMWAKSNGIQSVKAKGLEVHFSAYTQLPQDVLKELTGSDTTLTDDEPANKKDDEELLYWSARP